MLKPKLITTLKSYTLRTFQADVVSGVIVGIVALPLAIALAIASGVSPDRGLITAVIAGFIISALGGSRVQIGGPTGAFVVIVYNIVQKYGIDGLLVATFLGGIILIIMGFAKFGGIIKFIPYPVIIGFTSGIAVVIFSSQIKDLFGLSLNDLPVEFLEKWIVYFRNLKSFNPGALLIGCGTIFIITVWQKYFKKVPGSLVAIVFMTVMVWVFKIPGETIGSRFGVISNSISWPVMPHISFGLVKELIGPAMTIAILAGIESLLSAVMADGMIGGKHRSNMELIAQGMANIASPLFGGMPATGAIARTVTNIHNGGRTPVAGIVHSITIFCIMLFFGKFAAHIPLACLSGILIVVAYRMSEWRSFAMVLRAPRSDAVVLLATFLLTVIVDLTVAIEIGIVLSAFLLIHRLSMATSMEVFTKEFRDEEERSDPKAISTRKIPRDVEVFEVNGPFFFGVVSTFLETMRSIKDKPKIRIIRMRQVMNVDATALNALRQIVKESRAGGVRLILSGVHAQPFKALKRQALTDEIGEENILPNIDSALKRAGEMLLGEKK